MDHGFRARAPARGPGDCAKFGGTGAARLTGCGGSAKVWPPLARSALISACNNRPSSAVIGIDPHQAARMIARTGTST